MSILLQNASASFVQSAQPDGRYHLVIKTDLLGHSELQDRLIKKIAQSTSLRSFVSVLKGANNVPQLVVHLSASETEIAALLAAENENRTEQMKAENLGRSYTDIAADAKFVSPVNDDQGVVSQQGAGETGPAGEGNGGPGAGAQLQAGRKA